MKPNIIMIVSHDTGRHLGSYGRKVDTPELNEMAKDGVQFNNYFCTQPQCSPSRGSILTGLYGHNHGMLGLSHLGHSMKDVETLPSELTKIGYETWLFGFYHESIEGKSGAESLGYQNVVEVPGNAAEKVTDKLVPFLEEQANSDDSTPFYLSVGFEETHRPFDHFEPVDPESVEVPPYLPDTEKVREDLSYFQASVKKLDNAIGRIRKTLESTGLDKNTLLIYTTDHGIAFPRAKGTLFDAGLETALIMEFPPGMVNDNGVKYNEMLCNIDLMPTLLEIVGGDIPSNIDGESFLPLLKGEPFKQRESFFCELTWHDLYHPMRGVRTPTYKYIRNFEDGPKVYIPLDIHESLSGQEVREKYYVPNSTEELYDLEKDPLEQHNLANEKEYSDVLIELRTKVEKWMEETDDPLLKGKVSGQDAPGWEKEIEAGNAYTKSK